MKKLWPYIKDFLIRADMLLLVLGLICSVFGIIAISSATRSYETPSLQFVVVQTLALVIGIGLFIVFTVIDIDIIADKWLFLLIFSALIILALIPFGDSSKGNRAWLRFLGIGIQPSEVVKIIYIVLIAKHASYLKEYGNINSPVSMIQLAAHLLFFFGLVIGVAGDLGSALLFPVIFFVVLFAAGVRLYWFAIGAAGIAAVMPFVWTYLLKDYQRDRILAPYAPWLVDETGYGITWQAHQSKLALASGQFTGTGLFNGAQAQSNAFPEKHNDFIFGVIGEEFGMIGCLLVITLLTAIIVRCVYVGIKSRNTMNMLVCLGLASSIAFQTFENIGMCMGIAPVIGITLPFFSYGGSSLFSLFAALGLISGIRHRPKPERFRSYG